MRNLKRALSLGLTAAMISGLMVMGSSAASSSYTDVADTDNVEAIEVLKAVGIMVGDESGDFNPDQKVTRNEMAVVMSNLMAYNVATYKDTSPFTDVPSWAEPYVAACYTNKITAGTSATTYGGSESVTTAQAALMVMKALGYFQYSTDFGGDWQLATVAQGNKIDLFTDVDSGVKEAMTRNDVAQLVLNALEAGTVEAEKSGQDITVGDITITSGVTYKYVTSGRDYATAINKKLATYTDGTYSTGAIVELGEKLYQGDLTKKEDQDDFGRPANIWEYQGKEVGTFAAKPDYTFTSKVTSKALYNEVGKTAAENYTWYVYQNGNLIKDYGKGDLADNKADDDADFVAKELQDNRARTGNGVITDVYVDGTNETVHVAIIDQYAATVLKVDKEGGTITLSDLNGTGDVRASDEFDATGYNEDDVVIYTYANDKIQSVYPAQRMEGEVTAVRTTTKVENTVGGVENDGDYFVVDGTTYKYNATATKDRLVTENVNNGVVAYLDAQGYVAYIDESAITYDYAYVLSMGSDNDQYGSEGNKGTTYYARLVLTDGTMIKVETDETTDALNHHIVSYSKDKNNVYSLTDKSTKAITTDTALNIENGKASMDINFNDKVRYTANANTVFIVADSDPDKFDQYDFTVYTGVKNVPDIDGLGKSTTSTSDDTKVVVAANGSVAKVVYIEDADVSGTGEIIFARADAKAKYVEDSKVGNYYEINAYKDGAAVTLKVKESSSAASELVKHIDSSWGVKLNDNQYLVALKGVTENSDGLVTSVRQYDAYAKSTGDGVITGTGTNKYEKDVVGLSGYGDFSFVENEVVAQYNDKDNKNEFKTSRINGIKTDSNDKYIAVLEGDVIAGICTVYVNGGENENNDKTDYGTGYTVTTSMASNGTATVRLTATRPEYIDTGVEMNYQFDVYVGGEYITTIQSGISGYNAISKTSRTAVSTWSDRNFNASDRVEVRNFNWTDLNRQHFILKVQDQNGNDLLTSALQAPINKWTDMDGEIRDFSFKSGRYQGGTFQITKITGATGTLPTAAAYNVKATISDLKAAGNDYVVVTIDTSKLEAETTHTVAQYSDSTVTVKASPSTGEGNYDTTIQAQLKSAPTSDIYGYQVTVSIDGTEVGSKVVTSKAAWTNIGDFTVSKNIVASDYTVKVAEIARPSVKIVDSKVDVSRNNTVYTITFEDAIQLLHSDKVTAGSSPAGVAVTSVKAVGNTLVVNVGDNALVSGNVIVIDAGAVATSADMNNTNAKITLTLGADGSWTKS